MNQASQQPVILGLSASLRNARFGAGSDALVSDLNGLASREDLKAYLREQSSLCLEDFVKAGRDRGAAFDEMYRNLQRRKGDRGLSNSEVALAAGLHGAIQRGAQIRHVGLSKHFPAQGEPQHLDELREHLKAADGILLSGPVYFGDRGSVAGALIDLIRTDADLQEALNAKIYGGIAVGAKRNGGQETTLIYQLLDMVNAGFLGIGNDSETTSQYGGTAKAGDVGTMGDDDYGLDTASGTGRRIATVAELATLSQTCQLSGPLKLAIWLVQDSNSRARQHIDTLVAQLPSDQVDVRVREVSTETIHRCIACDICPTHIGPDSEYRCIIKRPDDFFAREHAQLIDADAVLLAGYSSRTHRDVASVYQRFMERTRYLRRGDYVFSDLLCAPLVLEETGSSENLPLRAMTSMLRHHTVMHRPLTGHLHDGALLNHADLAQGLQDFVHQARQLTAGRLRRMQLGSHHAERAYNPVGYVLSTERDRAASSMQERQAAVNERKQQQSLAAAERLVPAD